MPSSHFNGYSTMLDKLPWDLNNSQGKLLGNSTKTCNCYWQPVKLLKLTMKHGISEDETFQSAYNSSKIWVATMLHPWMYTWTTTTTKRHCNWSLMFFFLHHPYRLKIVEHNLAFVVIGRKIEWRWHCESQAVY